MLLAGFPVPLSHTAPRLNTEKMTMYQKAKDGIYYHPKMGRIVEHYGYSTRIHWSPSMIDYLRQHFPTTLNEELAGCLGVSQRTMIRKARELGLQKDEAWLRRIWNERRKMAHLVSKSKGYPGGFRKGEHSNPDGEFKKGHQHSEEWLATQSEKLKRWYRLNPLKAKAKAKKAWATRRRGRGPREKTASK